MITHMFRELLNYCVTNITSNGTYSLSLTHLTTESNLYLGFWSGNVFHQVCVGTGPRGFLIPRRVLTLVSSLISLFETPPPCACLVGMGERLNSCLVSALPGQQRPNLLNNFGVEEFERCLALPTAKIIERHDYKTIIDFLLLKLRTALDRDWLQSLPLLHKVRGSMSVLKILLFFPFHNLIILSLFCFQCVVSLQYTLSEASSLIDCFSRNWNRIQDHLTQVSRLPAYRFHMREVSIFDINLS